MKILLAIVVVVCSSCGSGWHLRRAAHHLDKAKLKGALVDRDTIYLRDTLIIKEHTTDTLFQKVTFTDTLIHETTRTLTKVKVNWRDSTVYVETKVKADTVVRVIPVPCEQIKAPPPWHFWVLCGLGLFLICWALFSKFERK